MREYVFGYGSLAATPVAPRRDRRRVGFVADLYGMRRGWGVAMDNRVDLPGYKRYLDAEGRRPLVSVCFLDVELDDSPQARVNGVCLPVDAPQLAALDLRERNYDRVDVTDRVWDVAGVRVWAYQGSVDGRARLREAVRAGTAVVHAAYLESVRAGFRALGDAEWTACAPSLDTGGIPVVELVRRELP